MTDLATEFSNKNSVAFSDAKSKHKYAWICVNGHEWEASYARRKQGIGCPICARDNRLRLTTSLATVRPDLAAQWSPKNDKQAHEVTSRSGYRAIWVCDQQHEWTTRVNSRSDTRYPTTGCPYCSGRRVLPGKTDLKSLHPDLTSQWHPTLNTPLKPDQVTAGSNRKVWWLGKCGHEWQATVIERRGSGRGRHLGSGCPYCTGKKTIPGHNDLEFLFPSIAAELDTEGITASELTPGSNRKLRWRCSQNHTWSASVIDRVDGHGCPRCASALHSSKGEDQLADFIASLLPAGDVERHVKGLLTGRNEVDIYVARLKIAVEFNGIYWHSQPASAAPDERHANKWRAAKDAGILLLQVWEDDWINRRSTVEAMLRAKLKVSEPGFGARKTKIVNVSNAEATTFLEKYHIQGGAHCSHYFGLIPKDSDEVVALLALKSQPGTRGKTLQIVRYATSIGVTGGFTKLLNHATKILTPNTYVTFSDNMVSDGSLYAQTGFIAVKEIPRDYGYVVSNKREHKFSYRLTRFKKDPELLWESGLSERQLADLNGMRRAWDAGKVKWELKV